MTSIPDGEASGQGQQSESGSLAPSPHVPGDAGRVALITGAGSGIGRQLAHGLAAEGVRIAAVDRNAEALAALAAELKGKSVACATADVTDAAAVKGAVRQLEEELGPTDLLIGSAGMGRDTPAVSFLAEDVAALVNVNLIGVANSIAAVLPGMRRRRRGHLVAISSLASYRGLPMMAGYSASKAGLNALMDSLRVELRSLGITVTTVCPGWVRTPMTEALHLPPELLMNVEEAGRRILEAIRTRRAFVAFPASNVWRVRLLRYLPRAAGDWLAHRWLVRALQR
jgi:short-subunit dehydrogenase